MNLPAWVQEVVRKFDPPKTGQVVLKLECYQGGVTKIEIGGMVRVKPDAEESSRSNVQGSKVQPE